MKKPFTLGEIGEAAALAGGVVTGGIGLLETGAPFLGSLGLTGRTAAAEGAVEAEGSRLLHGNRLGGARAGESNLLNRSYGSIQPHPESAIPRTNYREDANFANIPETPNRSSYQNIDEIQREVAPQHITAPQQTTLGADARLAESIHPSPLPQQPQPQQPSFFQRLFGFGDKKGTYSSIPEEEEYTITHLGQGPVVDARITSQQTQALQDAGIEMSDLQHAGIELADLPPETPRMAATLRPSFLSGIRTSARDEEAEVAHLLGAKKDAEAEEAAGRQLFTGETRSGATFKPSKGEYNHPEVAKEIKSLQNKLGDKRISRKPSDIEEMQTRLDELISQRDRYGPTRGRPKSGKDS